MDVAVKEAPADGVDVIMTPTGNSAEGVAAEETAEAPEEEMAEVEETAPNAEVLGNGADNEMAAEDGRGPEEPARKALLAVSPSEGVCPISAMATAIVARLAVFSIKVPWGEGMETEENHAMATALLDIAKAKSDACG